MTKHKQGIPGRGRLLFRDVTAVQNDPLLCIYIYIYMLFMSPCIYKQFTK